jgi:Bacterial regulatory proteins, tetR family
MARSVIYAPGVTTDTSPSKDARPYHHGDLRRALVEAALQAIAEVGPAAVSLRDLARRTGVSHAAPAHHFGDKAGLLTASPPTGSGAWPPPSARPTRPPGASWRSG